MGARALTWPAPAPPPPLRPDGIPVVADGRVVVQIAVASYADTWDHGRWGQATWDAIDLSNVVDMTCDVEGLSITRGRQDPLAPYVPGKLTLSVIDPERRWSPAAVTPGGERIMRVGLPIRVVCLTGDAPAHQVVPLFAGELEAVDELDDGSEPPLVAMAASGAMRRLGNDQIDPGTAGEGATAGPRIAAVLDVSSFPDYWPRNLEAGTEPLQLFDLEVGETAPALELLELCANSDGGALFEDAAGGLVYASRASLEAAKPPVAFTDYPQAPDDLCPVSITLGLDADNVINAVGTRRRETLAEPDPPTIWAEDQAAISWSGRRAFELDGLLHTSDSHGAHLAAYLLERSARADFKVAPVVGEVLTTPRWLEVATSLELGDPLTIRRNDGLGQLVNVVGYVDGLRHDIVRRTWTLQITPGGSQLREQYARWGRSRWDAVAWV